MIRLKCLRGIHEDQVFEFEEDSILIGRGADCDLRLDDAACSRHHAVLEWTGGEYLVTDLKSTNGILLNGTRVEQAPLRYGDRLAVGRNLFIFLAPLGEATAGKAPDGGEEEAGPLIRNTVTSQEARLRVEELADSVQAAAAEGQLSSRLLEEIRAKNRRMQVLHRLSLAITRTLELEDLSAFLGESVLENFEEAERVSIYVKDRETGRLKELKVVSRRPGALQPVSQSLLRRVEKERVAVLASDAAADHRFADSESVSVSNLRSLMCVPLTTGEAFLGAIYVENCTRPNCFTREDLELLTVAANQAAVAVQNASLYEELQYAFYDTMRSLGNAIEAKDRYTRGHSARVAHYAVGIARELGLAPQRIAYLRLAAELHDIGKIAIKEDIIGKAGKLTDDEYDLVKQHPQLGVNILKPIRFLRPILPFILHHHERLNGEGYPAGLRGEEIPLEARILNLADAFDAMTTTRPYNRPRSYEEALEQCHQEAGVSFDAACVEALARLLEKRFTRTVVSRTDATDTTREEQPVKA